MAEKRHKLEEIVAKLRQVDVLVSQGQTVVEAIRAIGVAEVTDYRWRQEVGGLKSDQVKRLKALEAENARLRKALAESDARQAILAGAARGNPEPRLEAVGVAAEGEERPQEGGGRRRPQALGHSPRHVKSGEAFCAEPALAKAA